MNRQWRSEIVWKSATGGFRGTAVCNPSFESMMFIHQWQANKEESSGRSERQSHTWRLSRLWSTSDYQSFSVLRVLTPALWHTGTESIGQCSETREECLATVWPDVLIEYFYLPFPKPTRIVTGFPLLRHVIVGNSLEVPDLKIKYVAIFGWIWIKQSKSASHCSKQV